MTFDRCNEGSECCVDSLRVIFEGTGKFGSDLGIHGRFRDLPLSVFFDESIAVDEDVLIDG